VFVPLPGNRCSVVWVSKAKEAQRLMALSDDELSDAAEKQSHSILGSVRVEPGRNLFPLSIESPKQFASHRVALVGESAHVLPPIGAQGLNMGLRDAADIADIVGQAMSLGEDPGAPQVLARYQSARRSDVASRMFAPSDRRVWSAATARDARGAGTYVEARGLKRETGPPSIGQSILSPSDLTTGSQKITPSARTLRKLAASDSGVPPNPISTSI
jgi:2-polyprenyl-6-methoxyphenol hydroxylase-like FAD-dependent oxidoreductase